MLLHVYINFFVIFCCFSSKNLWLCVPIMSHRHFRMNLHSVVVWMSRNSLLKRCNIWKLSDCNRIWTHNYLVCKWTLKYYTKLVKYLFKWLNGWVFFFNKLSGCEFAFCCRHLKKCVFIIFSSFFDEVSNFCNRILTSQKPELVKRNCQWNCM